MTSKKTSSSEADTLTDLPAWPRPFIDEAKPNEPAWAGNREIINRTHVEGFPELNIVSAAELEALWQPEISQDDLWLGTVNLLKEANCIPEAEKLESVAPDWIKGNISQDMRDIVIEVIPVFNKILSYLIPMNAEIYWSLVSAGVSREAAFHFINPAKNEIRRRVAEFEANKTSADSSIVLDEYSLFVAEILSNIVTSGLVPGAERLLDRGAQATTGAQVNSSGKAAAERREALRIAKLPKPGDFERWGNREDRDIDAITFLRAHWGRYLAQGILYRDDLERLDEGALVQAVRNRHSYLKRHGQLTDDDRDLDVILPPASQRILSALAASEPTSAEAEHYRGILDRRQSVATQRAQARARKRP